MAEKDPSECQRGQSDWNYVKGSYDRCVAEIGSLPAAIESDAAYVAQQNSATEGVNTKLYYLNEQVTAKKQKITELEQAQSQAPEQAERDRLESELTTLRYELDGLEREREALKARREEIAAEVAQIEERLSARRAELERSQSLARDYHRQLAEAKDRIERNCENTSGYDLPNSPY